MPKISGLSPVTFMLPSDYVPLVQSGVTRSADVPLLLGQRFNRPALSGFTWVNQNAGSTATELSNGDIALALKANGSQNVQGMYRTLPAASNFTVTACINPMILDETQIFAGIFLLDANNQNIFFWGVGHSTTPYAETERPCIGVMQLYAVNSYQSKPFMVGFPSAGPLWLRIKDDGTNRLCSFSRDGVTWVLATTRPRSELLTTPSRAAFGANACDPNSTGVDVVVGLKGWTITTP